MKLTWMSGQVVEHHKQSDKIHGPLVFRFLKFWILAFNDYLPLLDCVVLDRATVVTLDVRRRRRHPSVELLSSETMTPINAIFCVNVAIHHVSRFFFRF